MTTLAEDVAEAEPVTEAPPVDAEAESDGQSGAMR